MGVVIATHVAASDCERVRPGPIAQPVNVATSLAFCAGGIWLLRPPSTRVRRRLGWVSAAAGIGSVAYHGPGGAAGRRLHDVTAVALGVEAGRALAGSGARRRLAAAALLAAAVGVHASSRTGRPLCRPDSVWQGHGLWHAMAAAAVIVAAPPVPDDATPGPAAA